MPPANSRSLTDRQSAVIERIDRRVPIKVIAQELGVSETRINQHIRALKDIYEVESLNELVEEYRASKPADEVDEQFVNTSRPLSEPVYTKKQLPEPLKNGETVGRDDAGKLVLNDVLPMLVSAPWVRNEEPKVVPGVLDGGNAVLLRLAAIAAIFFGILASVILVVTAGMMISEVLDGKAEVSEDYINSDG